MALVLEYLFRSGAIKQMATFPTELFLENKFNQHKLLLTISEDKVKHWFVEDCKPYQVLPSFKEYKISDPYTSKYVILQDYIPLPFEENPYPHGKKQLSDMPYAVIQKKDYEDYLDNYYNPATHFQNKENWLWDCFKNSNQGVFYKHEIPLNESYFSFRPRSDFLNVQRRLLERYDRQLWSIWMYWKKYFLKPNPVAGELLFADMFSGQRLIN